MRRIAHVSDLHFGTELEGLPERLLARLAALAPHLVVVSGDLTQRARPGQFAKAQAFLAALPAPWIAVPGNHDIPLYNFPARFLRPFAAYRRHVAPRLEPEFRDDLLDVAGVNTVNPFAWQSGRFTTRTYRRLCERFSRAGDRLRIVAMHHPLTHAPQVTKTLMQGAPEALAELADCGADVVLCGHLHAWAAAPTTAREGGRELLLVQAGTALSTRLRGEENDFNLLTVDGPSLTVDRHAAGDDLTFARVETHRFRREDGCWRRQVQSSTTFPDDPDRMAAKPSAKFSTLIR